MTRIAHTFVLALLATLTFSSISTRYVSAQETPAKPNPFQVATPLSPPKIALSCLTLPLIAQTMASRHMSFSEPNEEILKRVADLEQKAIDPTKILLLQKEYDEMGVRIRLMVHDIDKRDCTRLYELHKEQVLWQKKLEDDVRSILNSKKFKVSRKTKLELDVDKRVRPKTRKQQLALRDKVLQLQMANLMAGGVSEPEAKKKLIHRYELATKRVSELTTEELLGSLLNAFALSLDPHSLYFSPDDLEDFKITMGLSLTGIGATLQSRDGFTVVKELSPGGPAERQGDLKPEDKIVAVAQGKEGEPVDVIDMSLKDVVKKIRGDKGTWVVLTVLRKKGKETKHLKIPIQRDKIDLKDQAAKISYHDLKRGDRTLKIALLDLPSFYSGVVEAGRESGQDVERLLKEANEKNADALVVDLSRNGGGSLQSAIEIVGDFLNKGAVVGVGDGKSQPLVMNDENNAIAWKKPVAVLTSNLSASASEIFAGALKDYNRALILGDKRTFGKGTVQQLMPLPGDLGVIKVTTSKFFLPGGASTQRIGVASDLIVPSPLSYLDIGEEFDDYALPVGNVPLFTSDAASVGTEWLPIDRSKLQELAKKSKQRMAKDKDFKEIEKRAKESKAGSVIKISEILDDSKGEEELDLAGKTKDELTPQAKEAMNILADYLEATGFKLTNEPKVLAGVDKNGKKAASTLSTKN